MTEATTIQQAPNRAKAVLKYSLMPNIVPQAKEMARSGFGYLAYLMAMVYFTVRILPENHAYLKPENVGQYGLRDVIAAAANRVTFSRKNIDQIVIFFAILSAVVILFLQIASFVFFILSGDAFAQSVFALPDANVETDIAYHLMREVFGIPGMFGELDGGRTALHQAFHFLLNFYNLAILLVAVLVFIYYVIVVVAETAQTGVPFGKRFSHIYAPIRLVIAVGLLVPLNYGLNGSQYVTLFAAKIGSNFASNAWINFSNIVQNPTGLDNASLIAKTKAPDVTGLVSFMAVAVTCREAYRVQRILGNKEIKMYQVEEGTDLTNKQITEVTGGASQIANANGTQDIRLVMGSFADSEVIELIPHCGSIVVPLVTSLTPARDGTNAGDLQKRYLELVISLWKDSDLERVGFEFAQAQAGLTGRDYHPDTTIRTQKFEDQNKHVKTIVNTHYQQARDSADFNMREETRLLGWGGAGIWYNRIAQVNGAFTVSTFAVPGSDKFPKVMQEIMEEKKRSDNILDGCKVFEPNYANNKTGSNKDGEGDTYLGRVLYDAHVYWNCHRTRNAANFILDTIAAIFGLEGLISIREKEEQEVTDANGNSTTAEINVHPLAKLSALGRGLVESAIRAVGIAMLGSAVGGALGGGAFGIVAQHFGESANAASAMLVSVATIGLSVGFTTYYILPFLPFIYFFFALGSWVKSIFEAMVGAPLWALAHLRIDGDGIPGKMASNGYFLIFEIFLKPILTVCGLLGGMAIFTALANILNDIFNIVVENTASVDLEDAEENGNLRSIIDVFFFTCLYAIILYMMALSSFKMINVVPNGILRWIGSGVSAFSDGQDDPAGSLTQYAAIGGARIGGQIANASTQGAQAIGALGGGFKTSVAPPKAGGAK